MLQCSKRTIEAMQDFLKKYDHIPHNEKSIKLLLAEEKFLKIKQVVEEEQTQPEYLQELLQSLLKDLQILNEIQPLRQETSNQIQKDQEEKSIAELLAEERLQKANQALNESQSPQEMRIQDLENRSNSGGRGGCAYFSDDLYYGYRETVTRETLLSIDDLPLDDSMILPEYESFTFDDEPVMAEVRSFDEINTSEKLS
ncbi:hypothetical protein Tco_1523815 [Tanacetum coccineum]